MRNESIVFGLSAAGWLVVIALCVVASAREGTLTAKLHSCQSLLAAELEPK